MGGTDSLVATILEAKAIAEMEQANSKPLPAPRILTGELRPLRGSAGTMYKWWLVRWGFRPSRKHAPEGQYKPPAP